MNHPETNLRVKAFNAKRFVVSVACLIAATATSAAEVTLFEAPGFLGGQLTLRGYTPNLANTGFNDKAASIVVTSGLWELCSDAEFKGQCATFKKGEYPLIDPRMIKKISSAREVGSNADNRGSYNNYGRGSIELFGQPEFRGRTMRLEQDSPTLAGSGFNDRASSVIVHEGTWQLCADEEFGGRCRTFTPGRYPDLGYGMTKEVSSARLVRSPREAPAVLSGGLGNMPASRAPVPGRIILYAEEGLNGEQVSASRALVDLDRTGLAEEGANSVYVEAGHWTLCSRPGFTGHCVAVGPGRYDNVGKAGLRRAIASVRPAESAMPSSTSENRGALELFSRAEFGGERMAVEGDVASLERVNFNDRASSIAIYAGQWEFCTDSNYRGRCAVFGPGRYPNIGGMTGELSSIRRLQR